MTPLLSLDGIGRSFRSEHGPVVAVEDFTLDIRPGEVFSLVGESGCGKSTVGRIVAGLLDPTQGDISYREERVADMDGEALRRYRLGVQYIHQDPYSSLIPSLTIGETLAGPLRRHGFEGDVDQEVSRLLSSVGLNPAEFFLEKFPNELSGGQRQRVSIARALTVTPDLLVADEAVSMIDVSLRLAILETIAKVRAERDMALVMITHDLGVARHVAAEGRIGVMYLGRLVEIGPADQLFASPQHPYTRALVAAADHHDVESGYLRASLRTEIPNPSDRPGGCAFHPRCLDAVPGLCSVMRPELTPLKTGSVACHVAVAAYEETMAASVAEEREERQT